MPVLSVLTLVDSTEHLSLVHKSLVEQSLSDWEWLVVPTGPVNLAFRGDDRVRVLEAPPFVASQGEAGYRIFGFEHAGSTHVMELDQYDQLHPEALSTMAQAVEASSADVLYGDFTPVGDPPPPDAYDGGAGWTTYREGSGKRGHEVIESFDPEPSSLGQASYAPAHAVTWRAATYLTLDGPDPNLGRAGGFDLMCRAYVGGYAFRRVERCIVRSGQHQYRVRDLDAEGVVSARHGHAIVAEWCRREGLGTVDLTGRMQRLPHDDSSVGAVQAQDFLGRLSPCTGEDCGHGADGGPFCAIGAMNEIYRVLVPGGWLMTETPSSDRRGGFQNPAYRSFWNPNSFWFYTDAAAASTVDGVGCRFQTAHIHQRYPTEFHERNEILIMQADLVALKGQRQPGRCHI